MLLILGGACACMGHYIGDGNNNGLRLLLTQFKSGTCEGGHEWPLLCTICCRYKYVRVLHRKGLELLHLMLVATVLAQAGFIDPRTWRLGRRPSHEHVVTDDAPDSFNCSARTPQRPGTRAERSQVDALGGGLACGLRQELGHEPGILACGRSCMASCASRHTCVGRAWARKLSTSARTPAAARCQPSSPTTW